MRKDLSRFVRVGGSVVLAGLVCAVAMAQEGSLKPPAPLKEADPGFFMPIFSALVILAACIGANLIPSKRGHQD